MSFKDKLVGDIKSFMKQMKWEDIISQQITEVLQLRPKNAFNYLHEKNIIKFKLQNSKWSNIVIDLGFFCNYCDPLIMSKDKISNKIMSICIQKYQQQKIRRVDVIKIINIIYVDEDVSDKNILTKQILNRIGESVGIVQFVCLLYYCIVYKRIIEQINGVIQQLQELDQKMNSSVFLSYLNGVNEKCSYIKMMKLEDLLKQNIGQNRVLTDIAEHFIKLVFD